MQGRDIVVRPHVQCVSGVRAPRPQLQGSGSLLTTDADSSEAHHVAERHPDRVEESKARWLEEAKANNVLPLKDIKAHRGDGTQLT